MAEDTANILINGSGILNCWRWPDISGLHSFKETLRVAIIGNGSSAIQILPQMQRTAKHIVTYIRNPTWISPSLATTNLESNGGQNITYTEEEKKRLRENPDELCTLRKTLEHELNSFFEMKRRLGGDKNAHFYEKLIPKWTVGCRRWTPGDGYLEALTEPNVTIKMRFDVSFSPFWELVGKDGIRLADQWKESPEAYFGICAPNMPNYFIFNGLNCPIGHGSALSPMDWMADYILRCCRKIATEDIRSVKVRSDATHDYNVYTQEFMKGTAWSSGCRSWYKNGKIDGRVTAMYAGSVIHYKEMLESFRTEDFILQYRSPNRFRFMGNGKTIREKNGGDLAYYIQ
ncbi:hypothetical protein SI65_00095 [Aspergillus cristatus]|uniref:Sterigmatocystin biosynthesis monooxygenase stcW n=1 Tax=Aspergillus cristatus TaxID=573508 RepID=A0A1E3BNN2_ASPCR|nr:hypothetical protein SI65_00095 [Aspergillus cristatus]